MSSSSQALLDDGVWIVRLMGTWVRLCCCSG